MCRANGEAKVFLWNLCADTKVMFPLIMESLRSKAKRSKRRGLTPAESRVRNQSPHTICISVCEALSLLPILTDAEDIQLPLASWVASK